MASAFRFLNPFYWFRDRQFDFLAQEENQAFVETKLLKGVSEKKIKKELAKIIGKKGEYTESPLRKAMAMSADRLEFDSMYEHLSQSGWSTSIRVYGKGANYVRTLPLGEKIEKNGLSLWHRDYTHPILDAIESLTLGSLVRYRDVTKVKIKELQEKCPFCELPLTMNVESLKAHKLSKEVDNGEDDGEEVDGLAIYVDSFRDKNPVDTEGDCGNCGQMIVVVTPERALKLFKDIWKAQKVTGLRLFPDWY